jgi:diguanylate cyclase (GGDEF)-like protein
MLASAAQVRRLFQESMSLRHRLFSSVQAGRELEQMMRQDVLTEISNRRLFEEELEKEWRRARREKGCFSVITADIDHFKEYNDRYGHPAGDRCLIKVAQTMQGGLQRPGDVVARIGGEEFAFLLPQTTLSGARSVAELIRRRILELNLPHEGSPTAAHITLSFGVASSDHVSVSSPTDLLRASDVALYEAKRSGRNRIAVFSE